MVNHHSELAVAISQWPRDTLKGRCIGIERETLRTSNDGGIAQTPHPEALGSALGNPYITTDYSEALLELITPPLESPESMMACLEAVHQFVYQRLTPEEFLWGASMPCVMDGEAAIPIAYYGDSHQGRMKHIYRQGLGHRYGKRMQIISGIHFNFSLPEAFWQHFKTLTEDPRDLQTVISEGYFRLIRNQQRLGWLLLYLFGCSPAVCKSFLKGRTDHALEEYDATTFYAPHATSLRMSDLGYTNTNQATGRISIPYNSLEGYVAGLRQATETPHADYQQIGVQVDGEYRQLNANLLQIENEFYGTIRPKQGTKPDEKPTRALERRGVAYVELRSVDVNLLEPLGIGVQQARFLETFLLHCLLQPSPPLDTHQNAENQHNLLTTAVWGREPGLSLHRCGYSVPLQQWGQETLAAMQAVAEVLDADQAEKPYQAALAAQQAAMADPSLTPSAQVLAGMQEAGEGFFHFARRQSMAHRKHLLGLAPNPLWETRLTGEVAASWEYQHTLEKASQGSRFEDFLADYFAG